MIARHLFISFSLHLSLIGILYGYQFCARPSREVSARPGYGLLHARLLSVATPSTGSARAAAGGARQAGTSPGDTTSGLRQSALGELLRTIEYPELARAMRLEGRVVVRCEIADDGATRATSVVESSGHAVLDRAAVEQIRHWRWPPGPAGVLEIPVRFRLE